MKQLTLLAMFCIAFIMLGNIFYKVYLESEKRIFAQSRMISEANETNHLLKLQQEQVKRTNELLGVEKIKLENANKKINRAHSEISIQNEIILYLSTSLDNEKLMCLITESIFLKIGVDVAAIAINQEGYDNKNITYEMRTKFGDAYEKELGKAIQEGYFGRFIMNDVTWVDNHVDAENYDFPLSDKLGSLIVVPLIQNQKRIGVLIAGDENYKFFAENKSFFETIVAQFLIAINNAQLYSKMEEMAIRDGLTGIFNRRHLTEVFDQMLHDVRLYKTNLSVALFDIDKFKLINDTYGHLFGDVVIQAVAMLAEKQAVAHHGVAGRYGGEEFVVMFPDKNLEETVRIVEELHQSIKNHELNHQGIIVTVRVSIGVTSFPETCKNPDDLLNRADWAMYYSKQNGRDRITIDSEKIRPII